jgi:hypothetical protein
MVAAWAVYRRSPWFAVAVLTLAAAAQNLHSTPQVPPAAVAVLGAPLLIWLSPLLQRVTPRVPGVVFYAFYPLHLLVILLVMGRY